jgi:hypothetical protein
MPLTPSLASHDLDHPVSQMAADLTLALLLSEFRELSPVVFRQFTPGCFEDGVAQQRRHTCLREHSFSFLHHGHKVDIISRYSAGNRYQQR